MVWRKRGSTSNIEHAKVPVAATTSNAGLTGISSASAGLSISVFNGVTVSTYSGSNITAIATLGTYADPGAGKCSIKKVDDTNAPGLVQLMFRDSVYATGNVLTITITVTGGCQTDKEILLTDFDPYDAVRAGLTALPNANAEAAGGLYTRGSGSGQIAQGGPGNVNVNLDTIKTQSLSCPASVTMGAYIGNANAAIAVDANGRLDVVKFKGNTVALNTSNILSVSLGYWVDNLVTQTSFPSTVTAGSSGGILIAGSNYSASFGSFSLTSMTIGGVNHAAQTGDSYPIVSHASYGNAQLVRSTTPANTFDVAVTGEGGLDFNNIKDATGAHTLTNIRVPNVTLADTITVYTGDTPQTGDSFARIGAAGAGLTTLAPASTALSTAQWTNALATALGVTNGLASGSSGFVAIYGLIGTGSGSVRIELDEVRGV